MKNDCKIEILGWAPKMRGAAKARWDRAHINEIVGKIVYSGQPDQSGPHAGRHPVGDQSPAKLRAHLPLYIEHEGREDG